MLSEKKRSPADKLPVPQLDDLCVLDLDVGSLTADELAKIDQLDWYRPDPDKHPGLETLVLVSSKALLACLGDGMDPTDPADVGLHGPVTVDPILAVLHRYDARLGFYHA